MDSFFHSMNRIGNAISREAGNFDETTWCILAMVAVIFGYFLLKGQGR